MSGVPFTVKSVFEYTSDHDDDLNFAIGQIIKVTEEEDADWYYGEYTDESGGKQEGIFPRNFVEKYEPPAPPRPSRPNRPKKAPEPAPSQPVESYSENPALESPGIGAEPEPEKEVSPIQETTSHHIPAAEPPVAEEPAPPVSAAPPPAPQAPAEPAEKPVSKPPPPAVAEKPSGGSFKDRIAAFNKTTAPPITPFKPAGLGSSGSGTFIKKPFVAPPPSRNAYVPPPRDPPPQKVYRREEDPEATTERTSSEFQSRESVPVPVSAEEATEEAGDQPKPTSLKDRIALLQKQQLEQAARHAEAAQKKEKPKKPSKKRLESQEQEQNEPARPAELERTESGETPKRTSMDVGGDYEPAVRQMPALAQVASPPQPSRELVSDTNDADNSAGGDTEEADETSTSKEDIDERPRDIQSTRPHHDVGADDKEGDSQGEGEEEEEVDPEVRRRMEIRERMAKMSGGMGMMGMFGPPGGAPGAGSKKPKPAPEPASESSGDYRPSSPTKQAPVPIMALPNRTKMSPEPIGSPQVEREEEEEEPQVTPISQHYRAEDVRNVEDIRGDDEISTVSTEVPPRPQDRPVPLPPPSQTRPVPPPVPSDLPAPPIPGPESRPVPPPPTRPPLPRGSTDLADEERSDPSRKMSLNLTDDNLPETGQNNVTEPQVPRRSSTLDTKSSKSSTDRRLSRGAPPPIPGSSPMLPSPAQARPPPPPPPTGYTSRKSTGDNRIITPTAAHQSVNDSEGEVTEYDGDYDTDIASGAKHKDALTAHARDSSFDEGTITDEMPVQSPQSPPSSRPPLPPAAAPRSAPPPPPSQLPKSARQSVDMPRAPPPPVPPPKEPSANDDLYDDGEYDPYRYNPPRNAPPTPGVRSEQVTILPSRPEEHDDDDLYGASPPQQPGQLPPQPPAQAPSAPRATPTQTRGSLDMLRGPVNTRRSMDVPRPSMDQGFIATDVDLARNTFWWMQPNTPPPAFQKRQDVLLEIVDSGSTSQGGTVSRDVNVLFIDYSQTVISVQYDSKNPAEATIEQRHEPPPPRFRQDQLESAHSQFGARISEAVTSKQNTTIADGTPHSLVRMLLESLPDALPPVGVRSYGALVYANLANASVQQHDEIRAGDIVTFRNARFQGHRGTMHQKYSSEVGKPDHVGVVVDWDGTKKKIRAWDQGRESKKVKVESFKLGDLRSGECRVWRVMPRAWVGWEGSRG